MTRTHVLRLNYVWWMVYGWMALSGLLVLVVQYVAKFSLPEGKDIGRQHFHPLTVSRNMP